MSKRITLGEQLEAEKAKVAELTERNTQLETILRFLTEASNTFHSSVRVAEKLLERDKS